MLLVSIHDVTPAHENNVLKLWELCRRRGVTPALLVVPNWHGEWPLEQYPQFVEWVRDGAEQGAELILHGDRHDENGLQRGPGDAWRAWGNTAGEAEFLTLAEPIAQRRIAQGLARLRRVGINTSGFVAPAWLAREATDTAARALGLEFTEDASSIHLLSSGRRVASPVVRWSSRTPLRAWGSSAVAAARWRLQRDSAWPRLALIHRTSITPQPPDRWRVLWTGGASIEPSGGTLISAPDISPRDVIRGSPHLCRPGRCRPAGARLADSMDYPGPRVSAKRQGRLHS